jgi:hypothetical protein
MDRLDGVRLFARVVETGSFSEGARQEGVGQSTVSKITTLPRSLTLVSSMTRLKDVLVLGTHFTSPNAGHIVSETGGRRFVPAKEQAED